MSVKRDPDSEDEDEALLADGKVYLSWLEYVIKLILYS
jgi:hypothetical protein